MLAVMHYMEVALLKVAQLSVVSSLTQLEVEQLPVVSDSTQPRILGCVTSDTTNATNFFWPASIPHGNQVLRSALLVDGHFSVLSFFMLKTCGKGTEST